MQNFREVAEKHTISENKNLFIRKKLNKKLIYLKYLMKEKNICSLINIIIKKDIYVKEENIMN